MTKKEKTILLDTFKNTVNDLYMHKFSSAKFNDYNATLLEVYKRQYIQLKMLLEKLNIKNEIIEITNNAYLKNSTYTTETLQAYNTIIDIFNKHNIKHDITDINLIDVLNDEIIQFNNDNDFKIVSKCIEYIQKNKHIINNLQLKINKMIK